MDSEEVDEIVKAINVGCAMPMVNIRKSA